LKRRGFPLETVLFSFEGNYVAAAQTADALLWRSVSALDMMVVESILIQGELHVSFGL
jgi:hypothetical protein